MERDKTSPGLLTKHPELRLVQRLSRAGALGKSKVQLGWGSNEGPGQLARVSLGVGGRCGRGLNPALPGAVEARNSP